MGEIYFCFIFWKLLGYFECLTGEKNVLCMEKIIGSSAKLGEYLSIMMRSQITELDKTVMLFRLQCTM